MVRSTLTPSAGTTILTRILGADSQRNLLVIFPYDPSSCGLPGGVGFSRIALASRDKYSLTTVTPSFPSSSQKLYSAVFMDAKRDPQIGVPSMNLRLNTVLPPLQLLTVNRVRG